jgi:hypothetical protein
VNLMQEETLLLKTVLCRNLIVHIEANEPLPINRACWNICKPPLITRMILDLFNDALTDKAVTRGSIGNYIITNKLHILKKMVGPYLKQYTSICLLEQK